MKAALIVLVLLLVAFPLIGGDFYINLASQIFIAALFATSLNLLVGYGGLVSLGHAAWIGLAAYTSAWLYLRLGLDPTFPLKYMVYFLLVVAVGGAGSIKGPLIAALLLGVFDVAGKYYVPQIGSFIIYVVMVIMLLIFPRGLVGRRV